MRLQSSHTQADRGLDAYFSPSCAVQSLIAIEGRRFHGAYGNRQLATERMVLPLRAAACTS